jgi:DNA replication protein DnaC
MNNLQQQLNYLKLGFIRDNHSTLIECATKKQVSYQDFLEDLIQAEVAEKQQRAVDRRIKAARLPILKTLDQFDFTHPRKINQQLIQHLFRLDFITNKENVVFCSTVGLGKTHLATALAHRACTKGHNTLFTTAIDIINRLTAARNTGGFERQLRVYTKPTLLVIDELGYMPVDKLGSDILFQVISQRYEQSSTIITTNRVYKDWIITFNNDATITSAILDRVMHHVNTVLMEGKSYRMRDKQ